MRESKQTLAGILSKPYLQRKDFRQQRSGFVKAETLEPKKERASASTSCADAMQARLDAAADDEAA